MRVLNIFINTLPVHVKSGGIKTFLLELLLAFAEEKNGQFSYILICSEKNKVLFEEYKKYNNFNTYVVNIDNTSIFKRIYFEQFKLTKILNNKKSSVLLNICNIAVFNCRIPQVTIIQAQYSIADLRKTLPAEYVSVSFLHKLYYDLLLKRSIKVSSKTIAVSYYMVKFLEKFSHKIIVIHEGVNPERFKANISSSRFQEFKPYILSLSTLFPHKNMNRVIESFSKLKKCGIDDYKLIIAGRDPDQKQLEILKNIAKQNGVEQDVIFPGWISANDVSALYDNASMFVFLSSVEFFGLPILEAMTSGVPVIAANAMSLPEVVNNAGVLVDPHNTDQVKAEMEKIIRSGEWRNILVKKGKANINNFKWSTTAKKFERVFLEVGKY